MVAFQKGTVKKCVPLILYVNNHHVLPLCMTTGYSLHLRVNLISHRAEVY